jgi:hypothetical protein
MITDKGFHVRSNLKSEEEIVVKLLKLSMLCRILLTYWFSV